MRLIGPRIYMALEPMPRYKLMWHREPLRVRAMGWLDSAWTARERFALPLLILIAAVACAVALLGK